MKRLYIFISLMFIAVSGFTQTPVWEWAKSAGGDFSEEGTGIVVDTAGNTYITGIYSSLNSGPYTCTFGDSILTSVSWNDIFIAKYNAAGILVWVRSAGGTGDDRSQSIAVDLGGNIYITGYFNSPTITFDSITLTSTAYYDIFVTKYNAAGHVIWAKSAGGSSSEYSQSIAVDESGSSYITGNYHSASILFDTITLTNPYYSTGGYKYFVAKYDGSGNVLWVKTTVQGACNMGTSVAVDINGAAYITGSYMGTTTFDTIALTNAGSKDIFTAKYDSMGNVIWAKSAGGSGEEQGNGISIDGNKNSYITGYFKSNSITFDGTILTNSGSPDGDVIIAKYDSSGVLQWAKHAISYGNDIGLAIASDANGNSYITGYYDNGTIIFGSITLNGSVGTSVGDLFVVEYNTAGIVQWAKNLGSSIGARGQSIALDTAGNSYLTGFFNDISDVFDSITLTNAGGEDIFVGKIGNYIPVGLPENITMEDINVYPNPAKDKIGIETQQSATIEILNIEGQLIKTINTADKQTSIDVSDLSSGVYIIKAKTERGVAVKKFVKE